MNEFFRWPDVIYATGLCEHTIRRMIKRGRFPAPVKISLRMVGWPKEQIAEWLHLRRSGQTWPG